MDEIVKQETSSSSVSTSTEIVYYRFNLLVAKEVLPFFSGDCRALPPFLTSLQLLDESMKGEDKRRLLYYAYNVKLSHEVRLAVSFPKEPNTFQELKERLSRRYRFFSSTNYPARLKEQLINLTQGDMTILQFRNRLLTLNDELLNAELGRYSDLQEREYLVDCNAKRLLDIFKFGLNMLVTPALIAAKTLDEAVEAALYFENRGDDKTVDDKSDSDEDNSFFKNYALYTTSPLKNNENDRRGAVPKQTLHKISINCRNIKNCHNPLSFLLRPATTISFIRVNRVHIGSMRHFERSIETGIPYEMGKIETLGSIKLTLNFPQGINLKHEFYVVDAEFSSDTDGVLGQDFLERYEITLDFSKYEFIINQHNKQCKLPIGLCR